MTKTIYYLVIISGVFLLFIMIAIPLHQQQIFFERDSFSLIEIFILTGFLIIIPFTIVSLIWLFVSNQSVILKFHGLLSLLAFAAEKVIIDEIARETKLGWETTSEWIILYFLFTAQLFYFALLLNKARQ